MLDFLYTAVSWVLLRWHDLFVALGMSQSNGTGWALSIVFLVITARLLLFRVFVKQVHTQRNMQKMQPKIKKLRDKYKDDRAELNRQMMKLQQEEGFNPVAGCLPMFLQIPVFIGLYHVLRHLSNSVNLCEGSSKSTLLTQYTFSKTDTCNAAQARIFDAPLAASFNDSGNIIRQLGGDPSSTRILLVVLLIISAGATFATQLLVRSNATVAAEGTAATVQSAMLYLIPIGTLASGLLFRFPLGVLLYWFTSNLWTLGQQAYIIRFHPPAPEEAIAPAGEVGRTLAPRPGQRPVRATGSQKANAQKVSTQKASRQQVGTQQVGMQKSTAGKNGATKLVVGDEANAEADSGTVGRTDPRMADTSSGSRTVAPRPGQRPTTRSAGKRPPAKRPAQTKKRR